MEKEIVKKLKKWLQEPGNSKVKIAAHFGYDSSVVISKWLSRGKIPRHQQLRVLEYLEGESNEQHSI